MTSSDMVAEAVKVANDKQLAVMIAKGTYRFPDNGDRVAGNLDIWWIVRILYIPPFSSDVQFSVCSSAFRANFYYHNNDVRRYRLLV